MLVEIPIEIVGSDGSLLAGVAGRLRRQRGFFGDWSGGDRNRSDRGRRNRNGPRGHGAEQRVEFVFQAPLAGGRSRLGGLDRRYRRYQRNRCRHGRGRLSERRLSRGRGLDSGNFRFLGQGVTEVELEIVFKDLIGCALLVSDGFGFDGGGLRLGKGVTEAELEIVFEDRLRDLLVIGNRLLIGGGFGIGGEMRDFCRRLDGLRLTVIDRQLLFQDQALRLIGVHVDIGHCLIELGLIELGLVELGLIELAVEIFAGDRLVGNGASLDRLNVGGFGLLDLAIIERQLVLKRHLDRIVEIGVECRLGRRFDSRRGAVARVAVCPESFIQRSRHFLVDGNVVLKWGDFQGTRDRVVEIIVEGGVGGRLRRTGCGKVGVIGRIVKDEILFKGSGKLVLGESGIGGFVSRFVLDCLLRNLGSVEFAHQLLFEVDVEIGSLRSLVCGRGLCGHRRLRPDRLTRVETHDPGQFRERIVFGDVVVCCCFQLGSVCHYCSRTRTQSDAMDVAQGWPLPAQCGQKVTGVLAKPNAFR
ncbi:hypothetical protein [Mesorhizobium sp. M1C.F.Ca.ET.187.01.1.1]|uniref:hypothetical protein n=2 Tax=Mesorhizobium TaxID=68287 RepID=UPI0032AF1D79